MRLVQDFDGHTDQELQHSIFGQPPPLIDGDQQADRMRSTISSHMMQANSINHNQVS